MPETRETQLVVLGAGPGGYAAAFLAADKGMKVTLIDPRERPGGTCLHVGCIPSKALLHAAKLLTDVRDAESLGIKFPPPKININEVRGHWQKVVETLSSNLLRLTKQKNIDLVQGKGSFVDERTVAVEGGANYRFENAIIATGSHPFRPPVIDLKSPRVMDSTGALKLEDIPAKLLVIGGGYIGLEMGYVYAALGSKVTVVEFTEGLLPGVDRDLVQPRHKRLEGLFHKIYLRTKATKLEETSGGIMVTFEGDEIQEKQQVFDRVLISVGRKPNSQGLGLDKIYVQTDEKGIIRVDERRRTTAEHIYAIGDVAGDPMLAHKATYEAKIAVEVISGEPAIFDARTIPAVVFTDPEIAWCGITETEAKQSGKEIKRIRFPWMGSGRALTLGRTEGLTKLIVDPTTDQVLGVGIVGVGAGEMIAEAMLAIEMGASARDVGMTMHPHPTLSETIGEAAESVYGMATHLAPAKK